MKRAADSVLSQTHKNIELIIVDDASDDDTKQIVAVLAETDPRVTYLRNEARSGACVSRNRAISQAKGQFITGLDDDDYFLPNRLESLLSCLTAKHSEIVFSANYVLDKVGRKRIIQRRSIVRQGELLETNWIGNQVFTHTSLLQSIGGFNISMPAWQDLECWYRLLEGRTAICMHEPTYVVDVSHPHERITNKKISKIFDAYHKIVLDRGLNKRQQAMLSAQLCPYLGSFKFDAKCLSSNLFYGNIRAVVRVLASSVKRLVN